MELEKPLPVQTIETKVDKKRRILFDDPQEPKRQRISVEDESCEHLLSQLVCNQSVMYATSFPNPKQLIEQFGNAKSDDFSKDVDED